MCHSPSKIELMSTIDIENKLNDLEIKMAFQEDLLQTLNDVIAKQDKEIHDLWTANRLLKQSMNELKDNSSPSDEAPPPHY